jgi:hypothetical protein
VSKGGFVVQYSYALLYLCFIAVSSPAQTFKSHQVGETFADFLKVEPAIQHKVDYCRTSAPHQLTPEEVAKLSPEQLTSRYGTATKTVQHYLKMEDNYNKPGSVSPSFREQLNEYVMKCGPSLNLAEILTKGEGEIDGTGSDILSLSSEYNENNRYFIFKAGHLVKFSMDLRAFYADAKDDISRRMGVAPIELITPFHNAFGATWNNYFAKWDSDKVHVELSQENNPAKPSLPAFLVETQELHRTFMDRIKSTPAPLD